MIFITHLAFGFLLGLLAIGIFHPSNQILFMVLVLFGSLLPDIDHPKSKLGRWFKPIGFLFEHRGFFHSLFMAAIVFFVSYYFIGLIYAIALTTGFLSHLISDALTVQGIMPFHPLSKFRIRGAIETGSFFEYVILGVILVFDVIRLIKL